MIQAQNNAPQNVYIQSASKDGQPLNRSFLMFEEIVNGGRLEFVMGPQANVQWARAPQNRPQSAIDPNVKPLGDDYVFVPFCKSDVRLFSEQFKLELGHVNPQAEIHYTLDGSEPTRNSPRYRQPIVLKHSCTLKMRAFVGERQSAVREEQFIKGFFRKSSDSDFPKVTLEFPIHPKYRFAGPNGLMDGILGTNQFTDGRWQGIEENDLVATIDLGEVTTIDAVTVRFLENQHFWIFGPLWVEILASTDGQHFKTVKRLKNSKFGPFKGQRLLPFKADNLHLKTRYLRIVAKNVGHNPEWHHATGGKSWLFFDEIILEKE